MSDVKKFLDLEGLKTFWSKVKTYIDSIDVNIEANTSGVSSITLEHGDKYELTVGGHSFIFTMPSYQLVNNKDSIGLIKNGSDVSDVNDYTPCPIVGGVPYYKDTEYMAIPSTEIDTLFI